MNLHRIGCLNGKRIAPHGCPDEPASPPYTLWKWCVRRISSPSVPQRAGKMNPQSTQRPPVPYVRQQKWLAQPVGDRARRKGTFAVSAFSGWADCSRLSGCMSVIPP